MFVFIYEYLTGGGLWSDGDRAPPGTLATEGRAMAAALAADFCTAGGVQVAMCHDRRLPRPDVAARVRWREVADAGSERQAFLELAAIADWTVVIAPEFGGRLAERRRWVDAAGGRALSPPSRFIDVASDKNLTAETLGRAAVPVPAGGVYPGYRPADGEWPAVLKPADGAGSAGIRLIPSASRLPPPGQGGGAWRIEWFRPGTPVSVAALCGDGTTVCLPACLQRLADDGSFRYLGGRLPLDEALDRRARRLARQALAAMPPCFGYVGLDLVLAADPADDCVIEVNPRLTTSYVGLRQMARSNLARAMLDVAEGRECELSFHRREIQFEADGGVGVRD